MFFNLALGQLRVTVGIQQTTGGGEQSSFAVGFQTATFQYKIKRIHRGSAKHTRFMEASGKSNVIAEFIFVTPSVKAEIQQLGFRPDFHRQGRCITHPFQIVRDYRKADVGKIGFQPYGHLFAQCFIVTGDDQALPLRNRNGDFFISGFDIGSNPFNIPRVLLLTGNP